MCIFRIWPEWKNANRIPRFEETVEYILTKLGNRSTYTDDFSYPLHYVPMTNLCSPCVIKYDAIAKIETFSLDNDFIIDKIQARNLLSNSTRRNMINYSDAHRESCAGDPWLTYDYYYSQLSEDLMNGLKKQYQDDLAIFGYSFDENNHPISLD